MDMDEMEISYDSENEQYDSRDKQKFNFLAKKTSKSKRKFNIDPFVLIEHLLSDHEDDDQEVDIYVWCIRIVIPITRFWSNKVNILFQIIIFIEANSIIFSWIVY